MPKKTLTDILDGRLVRGTQTAAGWGKRSRPLTLYSPTTMMTKGLMRVKGIPISEIQLEYFADPGEENLKRSGFQIQHVDIITQLLENREQLSNRFSDGIDRFGIHLHYTDPRLDFTNNGSGDAILTNIEERGLTGDSVILPNDNLFEFSLEKVLKNHRSSGAIVTIMTIPMHPRDTIRKYGLIDVGLDNRVLRLIEKPSNSAEVMATMGYTDPSRLDSDFVQVNTAGYIVDNDQLRDLTRKKWVRDGRISNDGFDMAGDLISGLVERKEKVYTVPILQWGDLGTPSDYLDTILAAVSGEFPSIDKILKRKGYVNLNNNVWIHPDSYGRVDKDGMTLKDRIKKGVLKIGPNAFVGRHTTFEEGVDIRDACIEKYTHISAHVELDHVSVSQYNVIGPNAQLRRCATGMGVIVTSSKNKPTYINGGSIIGPRVVIPEGAKLRRTTIFPGYTFDDSKEHVYDGAELRPTEEQVKAFMKNYL